MYAPTPQEKDLHRVVECKSEKFLLVLYCWWKNHPIVASPITSSLLSTDVWYFISDDGSFLISAVKQTFLYNTVYYLSRVPDTQILMIAALGKVRVHKNCVHTWEAWTPSQSETREGFSFWLFLFIHVVCVDTATGYRGHMGIMILLC